MSQDQSSNLGLLTVWEELWSQLKTIEQLHLEYNDIETPQLPKAVVQGARRLIRSLEARRETPPTVVSGSCDATIVFEWHNWESQKIFRSLEVLNEDKAEEFILEADGHKTLHTVTF